MSKHSNREKEVMLWLGKNWPDARVFRFDVGQAYAKFSVKSALQEYKKTKSITMAMKKLVVVTYGVVGWPDLIIGHYGIAVGVEIKVGKDYQKPDQVAMENTFNRIGWAYILCDDKRSIEDQLNPTLTIIKETMEKLWHMQK